MKTLHIIVFITNLFLSKYKEKSCCLGENFDN